MFARLCGEAITNHSEKQTELRKIKNDLEQFIEKKITELLHESTIEVIPIQKLVRVQVGSALITLKNLTKK